MPQRRDSQLPHVLRRVVGTFTRIAPCAPPSIQQQPFAHLPPDAAWCSDARPLSTRLFWNLDPHHPSHRACGYTRARRCREKLEDLDELPRYPTLARANPAELGLSPFHGGRLRLPVSLRPTGPGSCLMIFVLLRTDINSWCLMAT